MFQAPADPDQPIWRYMDFPKLLSLLDRKELFFPRADRLNDQYEGSVTAENIRLRPEWYGEHLAVMEPHFEVRRIQRKWIRISSWHMNEHESAAMWDLYGRLGQGV